MTRQLFGVLSALVLAGFFLSGCRSPQTEEEPIPIVDPPDTSPTRPVEPPDPVPPQITDDGRIIIKGRDGSVQPLDHIFYFEYDQARLDPNDIRVLAVHAQILRDYRNYSVQIEGHCDERGTREYNLALGERRWQAVRRYLISAGVRSTQIDGTSFGEERPMDPGHDESAWAKNRRAAMIYRQ